jgi:hypothetical protein
MVVEERGQKSRFTPVCHLQLLSGGSSQLRARIQTAGGNRNETLDPKAKYFPPDCRRGVRLPNASAMSRGSPYSEKKAC